MPLRFSFLLAPWLHLTIVSSFLVRVLCYPNFPNLREFTFVLLSILSSFLRVLKFISQPSLRNTQHLILMASSFASRTEKWFLSYKAPILALDNLSQPYSREPIQEMDHFHSVPFNMRHQLRVEIQPLKCSDSDV